MRLPNEKQRTRLWFVLLIIFATLLPSVAAQQGGTTRYTYDEKGRLETITLPNGERATYHYDSTGNLVSIERRTQTTITDFSPTEGPVGTQITINGFGFLTEPTENEVKINDVSLPVLAATVNELVVEVPLGATSGPLTVSNNTNGTATGAQDFTVLADSPPSITSFSPFIGGVGDSVTIVGTGFATTPADNLLKFNDVTATITSVTETTIVANVPAGATTGRISLATPNGISSSFRNFIVTDAEFIGQMNIGETKTVTITTPNRTGLLSFNGVEGQIISLAMTDMVLVPAFRVTVTLFDPSGRNLGRLGNGGETFEYHIPRLTLPATGKYTLLIDLRGGTGSLKLTVSNVVDQSGTIQIDGPPVTLNFSSVGQHANLTFSGTSGQRLLFRRYNVTGFAGAGFRITDPNGQDVNLVDAGDTLFRYNPLPETGTYTLTVNPSNFKPATGSVTVSLATQPADVTGSITIDGPAVQFANTIPGQDISVTFNGTAGQHVNLEMFPVTFANALVRFYSPDGGFLSFGRYIGTQGSLADLGDLPLTGTYTISIVPVGESIGSAKLRVFVPVPIPITPDGPPVQVSFPTPLQRPKLTFNGTAGQRVSIIMSDVTIGRYFVQILRPGGTVVSSTFFIPPFTFFVDAVTLPGTETYTIAVIPQDFNLTGSATVKLLNVPPDITGTITIGGDAFLATTTVPGQNIVLRFNGTTGQQITLHFTDNTIAGCPTITVTNPGTTFLYSSFTCNASLDAPLALQETGIHTITINPSLNNIGSISVSITSP